jgi:hypothetical protein
MNMMVSAIAITSATAVKPAEAGQEHPDAEIIAAGKAFEPLLSKYLDAQFTWTRLSREASDETEAKFPSDDFDGPGENPKWAFHLQVGEQNGSSKAHNRLSEIHEKMEPLADLIREAAAETIEGLRAKTLVSIWECQPSFSSHEGEFDFSNEDSHRSLFRAAVALTGLQSQVSGIEARLAADAADDPDDATSSKERQILDLADGAIPEYPPEIFGKLPEGFVLEEQTQIETLCFWHRKAIEVTDAMQDRMADAADADAAWEEFSHYCEIKNRILAAVLSASATRPGQVAAQLRAVVAEFDCLQGPATNMETSIEEVLQASHIVKMSAELTKATAPIVPKKHVGSLQRGRKLTRAGLLTRYQSFLVQELETVSWNLYGERDYAKHIIFFDDAVRARCTSNDRCYPFFDERGLTARARAVLQSLKIDTESNADRA